MKHKIEMMKVLTFVLVFAALSLVCWLKPEASFSESERRLLATMPDASLDTVLSGEYMEDFETYTVDQFPFRERFRTVKALFATKIFGKMDNNGLYTADGHISKMEYPENPQMLEHAAEKFQYLYDTYMKDTDVSVYLSVIPDKNYFLAEENGYLSLDYPKLMEKVKESVPYMEYIDIFPLLTVEDYYQTDSHWKQESIPHVAEHLVKAMGADASASYTVNTLNHPFRGVYLGQSALPLPPDAIRYLTNDTLENCVVSYYDNGYAQKGEMYNMEKAYDKDPYEMFLSGTSPLITIENPAANTEKELILFRDSFGSSIAPLFAPGYRKITVVDIRYLQSNFVGSFVEFDTQDVLFLYSTTLLNNSTALR